MTEHTEIPPATNTDIRNHVLLLRRQCGISRKELAGEVGLNYRTVGYIERQDYIPSLPLVYTMADYFGVEPYDLFFRRAEKRSRPTSRRGERWLRSTEDQRPAARRIFDNPIPDKVLTAILDTGGADADTLKEMVGLSTEEISSSLAELEQSGLVYTDTEPGLLFGRLEKTLHRPTEDGRQVVARLYLGR